MIRRRRRPVAKTAVAVGATRAVVGARRNKREEKTKEQSTVSAMNNKPKK